MSSKTCGWGYKTCGGKCIPRWQECEGEDAPSNEVEISSSDLKLEGVPGKYTDLRKIFEQDLVLRQEILISMVNYPNEGAIEDLEKLSLGLEQIRQSSIDGSESFSPDFTEYGISRLNDIIIDGSDTVWTAVLIAADSICHMFFALTAPDLRDYSDVSIPQVSDALSNSGVLGLGNTFQDVWTPQMDLSNLMDHFRKYEDLGREGILSKSEGGFVNSTDPTTNIIEFFQDLKATIVFGFSSQLMGTGENWKPRFRAVFTSLVRLFKE